MTLESTGEVEPNPTDGLDEVVHQRVRLGILTVTHSARRVDFGYLQDALELTGGNLSQHLRVLEGAGLVRIQKTIEGRRPRTWVSITAQSRRVLLHEIAALEGHRPPRRTGHPTTAVTTTVAAARWARPPSRWCYRPTVSSSSIGPGSAAAVMRTATYRARVAGKCTTSVVPVVLPVTDATVCQVRPSSDTARS